MNQVSGCSLIGEPEVAVGAVIEVHYLYYTGSRVHQPRMHKIRDDKDPQDCTIDHFHPYSREIV